MVRGRKSFIRTSFSIFHILIPLFLTSSVFADSFWQKLTWTTTDGVKLVGLYHPSSRAGANTWVLLHGLGSSKEEWDAFAKKMADQGNGSFIYDARGHADSVQTTTGETLSYKSWQTGGAGSPWDAMPSDLASAVQMLQKRKRLPEKRIAVGGASLGANVALVYASQHPLVPALVLLSPGVDYAGIQIGSRLRGVSRTSGIHRGKPWRSLCVFQRSSIG